jgi:four helix bundle protein
LQDFRNLRVWEKSHHLTLAVYTATRDFPRAELYGLTSQMRRAGSSIAANIAEGCGRGGDGDFRRFLHFAMGSASELEYHLLLAHDLDLLSDSDHRRLAQDTIEVKRMLAALIRRLKTDS